MKESGKDNRTPKDRAGGKKRHDSAESAKKPEDSLVRRLFKRRTGGKDSPELKPDVAPEPTAEGPVVLADQYELSSEQTLPQRLEWEEIPDGQEEPVALSSDSEPDPESELEPEPEPEPAPPPVDAEAEVIIEADKMSAGITVYPPENDGAEVTRELLDKALADAKVVYGIDGDMLNKIVDQKLYHSYVTVAKGKQPLDGQNGEVMDEFPRQREFKLKTKEDGSIDFKDLNLIINVTTDTLLCTITKPTQPEDGMNVLGHTVGARPGKPAHLPQGKNTRASEDGMQLFASTDGNLVFSDNRFHVEQVFLVKGNVDNSVGNIDFSGDVVVQGDVLEGYVIRSKGNVSIKGMVEGASIYAEGNITIMNGMNGMSGLKKGVLESKKEIRSKYLENCTIKAEGCIYADSIINSTVFCNDKLVVTGRRGAIIGGSITVLRSIEAKVVGTPSYTSTSITLGATPGILIRRGELIQQIDSLKREMTDNANNITYLERFEAAGNLSNERRAMLVQLRRQKPIQMLKLSQLTKAHEDVNEIIQNVAACRLTCGQIHPPTRITIGHAFTSVQDTMNKCFFYYDEGEIKFGYK